MLSNGQSAAKPVATCRRNVQRLDLVRVVHYKSIMVVEVVSPKSYLLRYG
nr:MAG TPA: hypothetical protein [Caudoviricetes sp.]